MTSITETSHDTDGIDKGSNNCSLTFGLYSAFLALRAMVFRSSLQPRFTVDTMFLIVNKKHKLRKNCKKKKNLIE